MAVEVRINSIAAPSARYVSWAPSPCSVRVTGPPWGLLLNKSLTLRTKPGSTGALVFRNSPTGPGSSTLTLTIPLPGASARFYMSGKFGQASTADRDTVLQVLRAKKVIAEVPLMVRVRKDANALTVGERNRFLAALATLNDQGAGRFVDFRNMHTNAGSPEAHGSAGFLPWHRAYLLDLERELQAIDPSVALPYWRFDQPAPNLFTRDFMGVSDAIGTVEFSASNPLQFWRTDGVPGVNRTPDFDPTTSGAFVRSEAATLALGSNYRNFRSMEGNPHGSAHTSFGGVISSVPTAARDPLFFLLHCNVDRLWAKWQRANARFDAALASSYDSNLPAGNRVGHNLADTMWPWNGITTTPRPPVAPGGPLAVSAAAAAPGLQPRVRDLLDFQGSVQVAARLGFDYDDVQFA